MRRNATELSWIARAIVLMPYATVLIVAYLPLAGALYVVTSTAWTALEHAIWRRPVTTGNG
jgi:YidC/Oxa1 family membrane protein insertase